VPALQPYLIEPIWEQFRALLPEPRETNHPLGCHRLRISDRVAFDKLVQVVRRIIREGWSRYRWEGRPRRRP
jgi:transposase